MSCWPLLCSCSVVFCSVREKRDTCSCLLCYVLCNLLVLCYITTKIFCWSIHVAQPVPLPLLHFLFTFCRTFIAEEESEFYTFCESILPLFSAFSTIILQLYQMNVFPVLNNFTVNFIHDSSIFFHGYWRGSVRLQLLMPWGTSLKAINFELNLTALVSSSSFFTFHLCWELFHFLEVPYVCYISNYL